MRGMSIIIVKDLFFQIPLCNKKSLSSYGKALYIIPGSVLLSHTVTHAVPSALESLTSVFGMGTGVSSLLSPPEKRN